MCGLTLSGTAYCWGEHAGTTSETPVRVSEEHTFKALVAGVGSTCGVEVSGIVYCWYASEEGAPDPLAESLRFATLSGFGYRCGITESGETYCWEAHATEPEAVPGGHTFETLTLRKGLVVGHACGITADGAAYCWGNVSAYGPDFFRSRATRPSSLEVIFASVLSPREMSSRAVSRKRVRPIAGDATPAASWAVGVTLLAAMSLWPWRRGLPLKRSLPVALTHVG